MRSLKPEHRQILAALDDLGGQADSGQIAEKVGLSTHGVSQRLASLAPTYVTMEGHERHKTVWKLVGRGWSTKGWWQ